MYRLGFDDEFSAILYVWDAEENYWPALPEGLGEDPTDPFFDASGLDLFTASHAQLTGIGIRTPRVYLLDPDHLYFPSDIAVTEDVRSGTLEAVLQSNPLQAEHTLAQQHDALQVMQHHRGQDIGKIALVERGAARQERSCEPLEEKLHNLASAITLRAEYSLIHGELGPDHVLVGERGEPVIIDIEGVMFFDREWEHVFLRLRFGEHYRWLLTDNLDESRLQFYSLAEDLSLIAGPLRLLDGDFPDRAFMMSIAESGIQRAFATLL